jgi:hypothetical protein
MILPAELFSTIADFDPLAVVLHEERHSDRCYTILLLDNEGELVPLRANLSVDGRWTLSPTYVT